jgi:hypothetical protein
MFQTYPIESFFLPEKFEIMLGIRRTYTSQDKSANFVNRVSFENQHVSKAILGIETIRYGDIIYLLHPSKVSLYINLYIIIRIIILRIINVILGMIMLLRWFLAYRDIPISQKINLT